MSWDGLPPKTRRCVGLTKKHLQCKGWRLQGEEYCIYHLKYKMED